MINRTTVRTRVIQTLFAYCQDGSKTPMTARKELAKSFSDTYSLYFLLLSFAGELTRYAESVIEESESRARATHIPYTPNRRFVDNRFANQIIFSTPIQTYCERLHLSWDAGVPPLFRSLYGLLYTRNKGYLYPYFPYIAHRLFLYLF